MTDQPTTPDHQPTEGGTVEQPVAEPAPATAPTPPPAAAPTAAGPDESKRTVFTSPRSRTIILTSGAGLALAGGVIGFGIGHATADGGDGGRHDRMSRFAPGDGRPDFGDRDGRPGQRGDRPGPGLGSGESGGQPNGADDPA